MIVKLFKILFFYILARAGCACAVDVEFSAKFRSQWAINTQDGSSQSLSFTVQPEAEIDFDNGWKLNSILRWRSEIIDGLEADDISRNGYSDMSKPVIIGKKNELELRELYLQACCMKII